MNHADDVAVPLAVGEVKLLVIVTRAWKRFGLACRRLRLLGTRHGTLWCFTHTVCILLAGLP
jgi:hypothetical protein